VFIRNFLQKLIKQRLAYEGHLATETIRRLIDLHKKEATNLPWCTNQEGDFLFFLAQKCKAALEIGFATGSTALYMLKGLSQNGGQLISVDYKQDEYEYLGVKLVKAAGYEDFHQLIEGNTDNVLPELMKKGSRFDLIFLDGWKTFDHLMLDIYYANQMFTVGGFIVFDDTRMPSVRRIISFLMTHYLYKEIDYRRYGENLRLRLWHVLTTQSLKRPFRGFVKKREFADLPISKDWNFYKHF
jgi:predicted O-methyltransferase YrrM